MPEPDPNAEWWTTSDVAAYLGIQVGTVSAYRSRGQMPAPTRTLGRTHLWRPLEIKAWRSPAADVPSGDELPPLQPGDPWRRHGERTIYDSEWMRLDLVDIEQPGGSRFEHHVITMKSAAVVALLSEDEERVLMLWRHRFVPNVWNWELPGGLVDEGESPEVAAARELEEETGYRAGSLERVVSYEPIIGMVSARHDVFVGLHPQRVGQPVETDEAAVAKWVDLDSVGALIREGAVANSGTLVALMDLLIRRRP